VQAEQGTERMIAGSHYNRLHYMGYGAERRKANLTLITNDLQFGLRQRLMFAKAIAHSVMSIVSPPVDEAQQRCQTAGGPGKDQQHSDHVHTVGDHARRQST